MIKNILAALTAFLMATAVLSAQTPDPMQGGIEVSKKSTNNFDGTYTINIEAFVTGSQITSTELVSTPVDAVLVLDYSSSMVNNKIGSGKSSPTRLKALQTAVAQFLRTMKANQDDYNATQTDPTKKITHKVAIVTFNSSANLRLTFANGALSSDAAVNTIISNVNSWTTAQWTRSDLGIQKGYDELAANARDGAQPIMVFFTDGEPTSSKDYPFSTTVANNAIKAAYNVKKAKGETGLTIGGTSYQGLGAPLYVVSVVAARDNMGTFMNNVSSNYPSATSMTSSGSRNTNNIDYLMVAPDEAALNAAFVSIASDITSGGAAINLGSQTITADIIMSDFQIAKSFGAITKDRIDVYAKPFTGIDSSGDYTWGNRIDESPSPYTITVTDDIDGNHIVSISGFSFSDHWCGYDYENNVRGDIHLGGQKLCLDIDLVPNLESTGGFVATNHELSGIYVKDPNTGEEKLLKSFGVPPTVYTPCDIIVEREGLKPGESAIYKVVRYKGSVLDTSYETDVVVTADANGKAIATLKGDVSYLANASDPTSETLYSYKIVESQISVNNPSANAYGKWDWSYKHDFDEAVIQHPLYTSGGDLDNEFIFGPADSKNIDVNTYDEAAKKNVFKKLNID